MTTLVCVTCLRDWWTLQRQILSFSKYLPPEQKILYVIEDKDPHIWLYRWVNSNCGELLKNQKVQIVIGQLYLRNWKDVAEITNNGWLRQQLLKLLVVKEQLEPCMVVDSKDFLIAPLDVTDLGGHATVLPVSSIEKHEFKWIYDVYQQMIPISSVDHVCDCTTPYIMNPNVIKRGINEWRGGDIVLFWSKHVMQAEFWLYHLWHTKQGKPNIPYTQKMFHMWPGWQYETNMLDEIKKLAAEGYNWFGMHRDTYAEMSNEEIKGWLAWLAQYGLSGDFNLKEIEQFRTDL